MSGNNLNVVNTNNWYQKMRIYGTNTGIITVTGTDPSVEMLLITSANDVNYCSSNYQLSKTNGFTLTFQLNLTNASYNSICAYFGVTDSSFDGNGGLSGQSGAVSLMIRSNVFRLYTNYGTNTIAASSNTSIATGSWQTITVTYTPSVTNTWVVALNGTNLITYSDSSYTSFANPYYQNSLWGLYGATSNSTGASIRAVNLSVKQSIPLSLLKNTYSFYPEECFINKLSTHSQTNAAAAFGLRLLRSDYLGPIINIRRGSDNATLDFYADSKGNIGTNLYGAGTTLLTWLAGSIGYVTRWYDQSGNGRDVINTTNAEQPKIGTPILDTMSSAGKSAARGIYALYSANSSYFGPTIKLRRSSDNAVSDFYSDVYGNLTLNSYNSTRNSFTSWIGSSTAYVDTWYDQSGSGNHATQSTTANQPIYDGTLKLIDTQNSSTQYLNMPSGTVPTGTLNAPYSFVVKHGALRRTNYCAFITAGTNSTNSFNELGCNINANYYNTWWSNDGIINSSNTNSGNTVIFTYNGSVHSGYLNNVLFNTTSRTGGTTAAGQQYLGYSPSNAGYLNGQMYSVFIFGSGLSDADRMACTANPTDLNIKYDGSQLLYNTINVPLTAGLDNYTYVCSYTPHTTGQYSSIVEQGSNPLVSSTRAAFMVINNGLYFAGHNNDVGMHYTSFFTPRKTVVMCNHNLNSGNVVLNDNGTIYTGTTSNPSALALAASAFCLGRNCQGGEFFTGNINEIIVFRNTLTLKESQLYFTPNAITRKAYRSQPRLQIKDVPKDIGAIPAGAVIAIDTQMLANMSPGSPVTSWNGFTGYNSPVVNAAISGIGTAITIPPYVSLTNNNVSASLSTGKYFNAGSKTFNINTNGGFTAILYGAFTGTANNYERIFDFGSGISNNIIAARYGTTSSVYFAILNGVTSYSIVSGNIITQNEWAVWTFRYTASTRYMEIIKNGTQYVTGTAGAAIPDRTLTNTWIGRSNWTGDAYSSINMSGLYVYASYLTDTQVASVANHLMYCTTSSMPSALPDYNNKVVRYGTILSQGYRDGQAMLFKGVDLNSYLDIQDVPNCPLTFCFWFYQGNMYGNTDNAIAALCSADLTGGGIQIDTSQNGTRISAAYSNGTNYVQFTNSTVALNTWYHIAFVVTPTTAAYYFNGSLVQSVSVVIPNTNRLIIGKSGDNLRPYNGYIQDIRVFDYALRADEISAIASHAGAGREIVNYNTPTNYLVNVSNWYSKMNSYQSGGFAIASGLSDPDVYYKLTNNGTANGSNTIFNSTRIQNYNSFVCSFLAYTDSATDHGFYFYCGATSSTTIPSGTAGTAANSSYYIYFAVTGTKGIYLFNDQGQQLAYSPLPVPITNSSVYVPITIVYNRSVTNTWTVNVASLDVLTYNDPNNTNWVSNIAGDFWGIGGRTTTTGMNFFIRRVELSYTPYTNSVNTTVNAQNNVKFPPGAMTAASTTFTGTSILDGVYTATASNSNNGTNPYSAFDNNPSSFWGETTTWNSSGVYTGGVSTAVTNLVTNTTTSYSGEWLQIQVPNAVTLNSFSLMGRQDQSLFTWRTPNTFYVAGSNDGSTWQLIHSTSGAQFTSAMQYFTCNGDNTNKYKYFRIITTKIGNSGANGPGGATIDIASWDLFTQMNTVNAAVIAVPPYSMTSNTTTFAGTSVYDGTYTLTASNTNYNGGSMGDPYVAFNDTYGSFGNVWSPGFWYGTGDYTGSVSTTVSGVSQSGEWVQIQIPNPIVLYSFSLNFWWGDNHYWAKSFLIAASNDGSTWTNIYDTTSASFVYGTTQTFVVTGSPNAYKYFRLIVRKTSGVPGCDWWILDQWKLYTNQSNFNLMKFPPASLTADTPVTFNTVNAKNWSSIMTYGGGAWVTTTGSDAYKQLRLSDGVTSGNTYCYITGQPVMNYNSFTFTFQLYCANTSNGDYLQLYFGSGGYQVTFSFEIYYYQGVRMYTTTGGNVVSYGLNWYNSAWNTVRVEYIKGPTNTWTMFFNESQIIQYSDPNWHNASGGTWGFNTFNGAAKFASYIRQLEMTIAPVSLPGNSIVSGSYTASASTFYINQLNTVPSNAFNGTSELWHTGLNYSGAYTGAVSTTVSGTSYSGDWIQLQTPNPVSLNAFSIYPRQDSSLYASRSPKNFVMAGSNDRSTWYLLHTATGINDWTSADKYFVCNGGAAVANKYSYFRLVTTAVNGGDSLNITNLNLYTPISLNNSITPATPKGLLDGLTWKYYDGSSGNSVSYYTTNTYRNIGRCTNTTNTTRITSGQHRTDGADTYSMELFGYFRATVSGTYTFYLASDDGSYLWIGSNALVGYTTSNANIQHPIYNSFNPLSCTVTLLAGTYYPIRIHWSEGVHGDDLQFSFTPPGGTQTYNGQGYFFSGTGVDAAFPQESAKIIKDLTGTNKDGVYYILVNGISTPIPCLMNDCYDGGGWMMLMKGTRGTTFQYSSNYWTSKNTLNAGDTTRNDGDAKYNTYNYSTVKDVLAIWPDILPTSYTNPYGQNGGSIFVSDGWTWLLNNWNETSRTIPLTGFTTPRNPHFPPGAMTAASTTFTGTGTSILDGVYTATASNSNNGTNPYSAFDNNPSSFWGETTTWNSSGVYTGGVSTAVTNLVTNTTTSYSGEWLQIQVPNAVTLNSFSLMGRQDQSLFTWRTPNTFYVAGSNDGSTWQLIHSTSGAQFTSAMQYFTCNGNNFNKYRYFRLITTKIGNNGIIGDPALQGVIDIAAWDFNTSNLFQTYGINNPFRYNGFGTWCSSQSGAYWHGFAGTGNRNVRWGFLFNNETGDYNSQDVHVGIGMGGTVDLSAGDSFGCCGTAGINRSARFELWGR